MYSYFKICCKWVYLIYLYLFILLLTFKDGTIHLPSNSILSRYLGANTISILYCEFFFFKNFDSTSIAIRYCYVLRFCFSFLTLEHGNNLNGILIKTRDATIQFFQNRSDLIPKILRIGRYQSDTSAVFFFFSNQCRISLLFCVDLIVTFLCVKHNLFQCFSTGCHSEWL